VVRYRAAIFIGLLVTGVGAAGCGPSPERLHCLDYCEQQNDTCLLNARRPPEIQSCGAWANQCVASCPAR
jgi:hypothetical protein